MWGKFPRRLRRLYGKIAEVIWKNSKPKAHITSAIFPYNLRNHLGNFFHIIPFFSDRVPYDSVGRSCKAFEIGNVLWNRLEAGKAFASLDSHFIGYIYLLLPISKRVNLFKKNSLHLIKYFKANRNYVPQWNLTNKLHDHMFMPSSRNWLPQLPW